MFIPLVIASILLSTGYASPVQKFIDMQDAPEFGLRQTVRLEVDEAGQCIYVKSEEGTYIFNSPGIQTICGLYIITDPDKKVEFEFQLFDISCTKEGLLSVIDGWELNGQFFPGANDHPNGKPFMEFCGKIKPRKIFTSSQNVGLLEYRIPMKGQGFIVTVRFVHNPKPCNVVLQQPEGTFTLRNYNKKSNCSVSVIFPLSVRILQTSIGIEGSWPSQIPDRETGLMTKCEKRGFRDFVEIRGGDGLDPGKMEVAANYCGLSSLPKKRSLTIACGNTAVRLVSSGRFENSVTFSFGLPTDLSSVDLFCPAFFEPSSNV